MSGLRYTTAHGLARVARATSIMDRITSTRELWSPNDEQCELWRMMARHRFLFAAKPRKVGFSLAGSHATLHETDEASRRGERMRSVFAIDTDIKALEHMERAEDMAQQFKIKVRAKRSPPRSLVFPSGAHYDFLTMGTDEPGRGGDIHRLHVTELPYAAHPERAYHALRTACADSAPVLIETTLATHDPFTVALWRGARRDLTTKKPIPVGTELHRYVSLVEQQQSYRSDEPISDDEWEDCKREGFTDRRAGAWWLKEALPNKCGGDRVRLMHDYPQHPKHLLAMSTGRVIEATPALAEVDGYLEVIGMRGDLWVAEIYGEPVYSDTLVDAAGDPLVIATEPIEHSGQVVVVIDSAQGVGKTNSIVLAIDKRDRRILACFADNTILHDDLARVAQMVALYFAPRRRSPLHHDRTTIVVEADGAGRFTAHELTFLGVPHELFWQSKDNNAERCVVQAKRRIEARPNGAPLVLQEECDELRRDEKNRLEGRKDCVMMVGLANVWIDEHPYEPPVDVVAEKDRRSRMTFQASLADHDAQSSARVRPRWGS